MDNFSINISYLNQILTKVKCNFFVFVTLKYTDNFKIILHTETR